METKIKYLTARQVLENRLKTSSKNKKDLEIEERHKEFMIHVAKTLAKHRPWK